jgi:hypothetical protein
LSWNASYIAADPEVMRYIGEGEHSLLPGLGQRPQPRFDPVAERMLDDGEGWGGASGFRVFEGVFAPRNEEGFQRIQRSDLREGGQATDQ